MLAAPVLIIKSHDVADQFPGPGTIDWNCQPMNAVGRLNLHPRDQGSSLRELHVIIVNENIGQANLFKQPYPWQEHRLRNYQSARHSVRRVQYYVRKFSATAYPIPARPTPLPE
jgi:hypothetical protein